MVNKLTFIVLPYLWHRLFSAFGQTQPSQDENGYYLIESAEHLKWFRDQVNASEHEQVDTNGDGQINMDDDTVVRLNAKLTADIDLGGESWTRSVSITTARSLMKSVSEATSTGRDMSSRD